MSVLFARTTLQSQASFSGDLVLYDLSNSYLRRTERFVPGKHAFRGLFVSEVNLGVSMFQKSHRPSVLASWFWHRCFRATSAISSFCLTSQDRQKNKSSLGDQALPCATGRVSQTTSLLLFEGVEFAILRC